MDVRRKLAVTLAAMALAGQLGGTLPLSAAQPDQIEALQGYLSAGDLRGLAGYVQENPALLDDDSPLAAVLADFLAAYRSGPVLTAFPPQVLADLEAALTESAARVGQSTMTASLY
jgi:hypothetical protein